MLAGTPVTLSVTGSRVDEACAEIYGIANGPSGAFGGGFGGGGGMAAAAPGGNKSASLWVFRLEPTGSGELQVLLEHTKFG